MERQTYGGRLLRQLRRQRGYTQDEVYNAQVVAQKTLSKIETGDTQIPDRDTLQTLLDFYESTFNDAHEVMKAFGYLPDYSFLPTDADVADAIGQVQPVLDVAPFPSYCTDFIARLFGYNDLFLQLSGMEYEEMAELRGVPIWQAGVDVDAPASEVLDADILADIRAIQQRMGIYVGETWFDSFIAERGEPFLSYWRAAEAIPQGEALSADLPVFRKFITDDPDSGQPLHFFIHEEMIAHDQRFRRIDLMPADAGTWQWVAIHRQGDECRG